MTRIWYAAYGSNLLSERLHTYIVGAGPDGAFGEHPPAPVPTLPERDTWLRVDHPLYFAGRSRRWGGSPAFLSWSTGPASILHAYLVGLDQFWHLVATENAVAHVEEQVAPSTMSPGEVRVLTVHTDGLAHQGKYDALLRLPDIDGIPTVTLTSSVVRERGEPSERYLDVVRRGLAESPFDLDQDVYLRAAIERSGVITLGALPASACSAAEQR